MGPSWCDHFILCFFQKLWRKTMICVKSLELAFIIFSKNLIYVWYVDFRGVLGFYLFMAFYYVNLNFMLNIKTLLYWKTQVQTIFHVPNFFWNILLLYCCLMQNFEISYNFWKVLFPTIYFPNRNIFIIIMMPVSDQMNVSQNTD